LGLLTAVKGIKKQNLVEVRSLPQPPPAVKLALESVCTLLGEKDVDWKAMRGVIMRENFISTIVNFNTEDITFVIALMYCSVDFCFTLALQYCGQ
jgi:dynein heavy chain 1, cytosolic